MKQIVPDSTERPLQLSYLGSVIDSILSSNMDRITATSNKIYIALSVCHLEDLEP